MEVYRIKQAQISDAKTAAELALLLWPDNVLEVRIYRSEPYYLFYEEAWGMNNLDAVGSLGVRFE